MYQTLIHWQEPDSTAENGLPLPGAFHDVGEIADLSHVDAAELASLVAQGAIAATQSEEAQSLQALSDAQAQHDARWSNTEPPAEPPPGGETVG